MDLLTVLTILAVTVVAVTYFSTTLKRIATLGDSAVDTGIVVTETILDLTTDTVGTYKHEVKLSNAEKRSELLEKYKQLNSIISVNELDALLADKTNKEEA